MKAVKSVASNLLRKLSKLMGSTNISSIGNGTVTGALSTLKSHADNKSNPHSVTKAQVGLGNCDNTADSAKRVAYATSAGHATSSDSATNANYANSAGSAVDQTARNSASTAQDRADSAARSADAANNNANGRVSKSGDTMTGNLNMGAVIDMNNNPFNNVFGVFSNDEHAIALCTNKYVSVLNRDMTDNGTIAAKTVKYAILDNMSYRGTKENFRDASNEIKKILDVPVHIFDYRPGFCNNKKNVVGMIVDEVQDIIPEAVIIPDNWDESNFNELLGELGNDEVPGLDQTTFIPYLIGMVQLLNKELIEQKNEINSLKEKIKKEKE